MINHGKLVHEMKGHFGTVQHGHGGFTVIGNRCNSTRQNVAFVLKQF